MRPNSPTRRNAGFMIYLFAFFAVWTGWVIVLYPRMLRLGDRTLAYAVVNVTVRLLVWVAPVLLYLRFVDHENPIAYLKLTKNWQKGIGMGILVTFINLLGSWLRFGTPHPSANSVTWSSMFSTAWLIGFIEEVPFRGFILQKLEERIGHALAIVTSSTLFLAIHLPGWIVAEHSAAGECDHDLYRRRGACCDIQVFGLALECNYRSYFQQLHRGCVVRAMSSVHLGHKTDPRIGPSRAVRNAGPGRPKPPGSQLAPQGDGSGLTCVGPTTPAHFRTLP